MQFPKKRQSDIFRKRDNGPLYLTADAALRLKERLTRLEQQLPYLISEAQRTAAYGDRSDNAEYKDAKSNLRRAHGQIFNIKDQLKRIVIITPGKNSSGTVQLGSIVVLETAKSIRKTFQILGPHETNPSEGQISYKSPLGAALMSHAVGDEVTIKIMRGLQQYRILEIT